MSEEPKREKIPRDWTSIEDFEESIPFIGLSSEDISNFHRIKNLKNRELELLKNRELKLMKEAAQESLEKLKASQSKPYPPEIQDEIDRIIMSRMEKDIEQHIGNIANFFKEHASSEEIREGDIDSWQKWKSAFYMEIAKQALLRKDLETTISSKGFKSPSIQLAPGALIAKLFRAILPKRLYKNTIEQMIGDFREEYLELLHKSGGKITGRMHYLKALLTLNCIWCTLRLLLFKLTALDLLWNKISK